MEHNRDKYKVLHGPALVCPEILIGTKKAHGKLADVMWYGEDVVGHVARMTDLTWPPPTSR